MFSEVKVTAGRNACLKKVYKPKYFFCIPLFSYSHVVNIFPSLKFHGRLKSYPNLNFLLFSNIKMKDFDLYRFAAASPGLIWNRISIISTYVTFVLKHTVLSCYGFEHEHVACHMEVGCRLCSGEDKGAARNQTPDMQLTAPRCADRAIEMSTHNYAQNGYTLQMT